MKLSTLSFAIRQIPAYATEEMIFPVLEEDSQSIRPSLHSMIWGIWTNEDGQWEITEFYPFRNLGEPGWIINTVVDSRQEALDWLGGWMEDVAPDAFARYFQPRMSGGTYKPN